jgi:thiamine pyrophosphate-dependent acetolactate synthase large subunit-like protein
VDLLTPDLPRLAEALGGSGRRVQDPAALAAELRAALERPGPTLIEVPA